MRMSIRIISSILFIMYVLYLLYLVFFSSYYGRGYVHRSYNFIPCKTILEYITVAHSIKAKVINIAGNIVAFLPMGFLPPIVFYKFKNFKNIAILILMATILIEVIQFIIGVGTCDVDDVILNWIGGIIGFQIYKSITKFNCIINN